MGIKLKYHQSVWGYIPRWIKLFAIVGIIQILCFGQARVITPLELAKFARLTSYDSLTAFVRSLQRTDCLRVEEITQSRLGRSLFAVYASRSNTFGSENAKTRVLLFAQQHGDEPAGKEALLLLLARIASHEYDNVLQNIDIIIVPQMNPDGSELGRRTTSDGIDLNRQHVLLESLEVRALHGLFERWKPQVTLDIHEFGATSRSWTEVGLKKTADVQIGMLTNPNTPASIRTIQHGEIFPFIEKDLNSKGYRCQEYIVGSPQDRIRHSTTDINDGRQSFGILGTFSFIQEGKNGVSPEENLRRRAESQLASIQTLLTWCNQNSGRVNSIVANERANLLTPKNKMVVMQMDHRAGSKKLEIPVFNLESQKDTVWTIQPYHDSISVLRCVQMPQAYIVPGNDSSIISLLRRHFVKMELLVPKKTVIAELITIDSTSQQTLEEITSLVPYSHGTEIRYITQRGDVLVKTNQWRSLFLTTVLEAQSQWGLYQYKEFESLRKNKKEFPILRIP